MRPRIAVLITAAVVAALALASPASARSVTLHRATHLKVSARTATELALTWRNPTGRAFTSIVIRYVKGTRAPATHRSGTLLARVSKRHHSYTKRGLRPGTHYAFSLFATDGHGHYSVATKVVTTTRNAATAFDGHWTGVAKAPGGGLTEPVSFTVSGGSVVKFQGWIYGVCSSGATDDVYLKGPAPIKANGTVARAESITPVPGYTATSSMTGFFHGSSANGTIDYIFLDCAESSWTWVATRS